MEVRQGVGLLQEAPLLYGSGWVGSSDALLRSNGRRQLVALRRTRSRWARHGPANVAFWTFFFVASCLGGCGSSHQPQDSGTADSGAQDLGDSGLCGSEVCGANTVCMGTGAGATCECAPTALACEEACVAGTVDETPHPNPTEGVPEDRSLGCVGQPVVVQRAGRLTAVRVVMPPGVPFTVEAGVLSPSFSDLGLNGGTPNSYTCIGVAWFEGLPAAGRGVGQGILCDERIPGSCPAPTSDHYTTVDLTDDLEVDVGDVLYFMFRFDTEAFTYPMAFQTHYPSVQNQRIRSTQNLFRGEFLAFETLVAECD